MSCTTILVGRKASYDGSTMISRNDDSQSGKYTPKKFVVVHSEDQPRHYQSVLSKFSMDLPDDPMRYTAVPNAVPGEGIWAACGVNECNVAVTATETITSNVRVLGADPLVEDGFGEEDIVVLTLPYIHSAREGVLRLGSLLEQYGTYEMNAIAFQDDREIWWLETIGGHHWMARRVPDDAYVVMPNQLGIDLFDFGDAFGAQKDYLCSKDLMDFVMENHLDLNPGRLFDPRAAFGSHDDADHVYNTPRAWYILKYFNPVLDITPESDDLPWCMIPKRHITIEDIKYLQSSHYQGTPFDPYSQREHAEQGLYRPIGVNRTSFMSIIQMRPSKPEPIRAVEWLCYGCNTFNVMVPLYTSIDKVPEYLSNTTNEVTTDNCYWNSRMIGALSDAHYQKCINHIEHYQEAVHAQGYAILKEYDEKICAALPNDCTALCEEANQKAADMAKKETAKTLGEVLYEASNAMKNSYARSDH